MKKMRILHPSFPCVLNNISLEGTNRLQGLCEEFADIFQDQTEDGITPVLRPMKGPPMRIHLRKDVIIKPTRCTIARKVPINFEDVSDKEVEALVNAGIIAPYDKPSRWISPAAFIIKPDNKSLRLITDFRGLNKYVNRPIHPFPTVKEVCSSIPNGTKYFMKLDAQKGYFQIPVEKESQALTCFILPQGRYVYLRAPMGLSCSGDFYCKRGDIALAGISGVRKIVDDILVMGASEDEFYDRARAVFSRCREHQITLSKKKIKVGSSVPFAGFIVSENGVEADPEKLKAVADFPAPKDVPAVRSFLGLANQLADFLPDLAQVTGHMRELLRKGVAFTWGPEQQTSFDEAKRIILASAKLAHYDIKRETFILSDASRLNGLGFSLIQYNERKEPQLIQCGSRSLTAAEKNYSTIELELLGIVYAILKCKFYLLGSRFKIITDHAPLKPILGTEDKFKSLDLIDNPRIQRLVAKINGYSYVAEWIAGKRHLIADALSRAPVFDHSEDIEYTECVRLCRVTTRAQSEPLLDDIQRAAIEDADYRRQFRAISMRFQSVPKNHPARELQQVWGRLSTSNDLIVLDATRIFVPPQERANILKTLHISHCGYGKTYALAKQLYYWPNLKRDIMGVVDRCQACQRIRQSRQAEKHINTSATRPWEAISTDLFHLDGRTFVIVADRFSGYPFVFKLPKTDTASMTKIFFELFCAQGFPVRCRSDGGPQYRGPFKIWCKKYNIVHELSSADHPASNGHAEAAVKNVKYLLEKYQGKWEEFLLALLEWRNTPRQKDGKSPAQMFNTRRQRTLVPCLPSAYDSIPDPEAPRKLLPTKLTCEFEKLEIGDRVLLQHPKSKRWDTSVTVIESRPLERSYLIQTDDGTIKLRNRRYLRKSPVANIDD